MTNAISIAQQGSNNTTFRNKIINGSMIFDQRNAGASVTPAQASYPIDRWRAYLSQTSKFTAQQVTTAPAGFSNSLLITSSSAYSVGASEFFSIQQFIEGYNVADLGWGTANAKAVTLSFQVYSSLTGTFGGVIQNDGQNRSYPFTYTVSSANTWTSVSITIPGDTTGTWLTTNGRGIAIWFSLGAGSSVSGTAGAWAGAGYFSATGAVSVVGTNGATWYVTGVQLEAGTTASPFENRSYGVELALCQRYFWNFTGAANYAWANGQVTSATNARLFLKHPVPMRASPTLSYTGTPYVTGSTGAGINVTAFSTNYGGATSLQLDATVTGGLTAGNACIAALNAGSDVISITAEL